MQSQSELDHLLAAMEVDVHTLAFCELRRGRRLVAPPVDAIMIHYVLAGTMHMTVPGHDPIVCSPGSIALIPPGVPLHVAADDGPATDVLATEHCTLTRDGVLHCDAADGGVGDLRYVSGMVLASFLGSFGLFDRLSKPISQNLGADPLVQHAYNIMLDELERPQLGARALTSALMKACMVLVLRQSISGAGPPIGSLQALSDPRFGKVLDAVLDRPADRHTVETMASIAGMSRSNFAVQFRTTFDMTPGEFISKTRLYHAAKLLRSTPFPVKLIAAHAGFASRSHFSRAFRAVYGMDPTLFREKLRSAPLHPPTGVRGS